METTSFKENSGNCEMPRKSAADFYKKLQKFHIEHSDKKLYLNEYTLWQWLQIALYIASPLIILVAIASCFYKFFEQSHLSLMIYGALYLLLVWIYVLRIPKIKVKFRLMNRDKYELKSCVSADCKSESNFDTRKDALKKLLAEYNQVYHKEKLENIHQYLNDYRIRNTNNNNIYNSIMPFLISITSIYLGAMFDDIILISHMGIKLDTLLIMTIQFIGLVIMIAAIIDFSMSIFSSGNKKHYHVTFDLLEALILGEDWDRVKQEASQDCNTEPDNE